MSDIRVVGSRVHTSVTEDRFVSPRALRDGSLVTVDWIQAAIIEGRGHMLQLGTEDAPIDSTTSIDDALVWAVVDITEGYSVIPFYAEAAIATWTTATLINMMIEVDNAKVRYSSGGTAFTPLGLRTGTGIPVATQATAYVGTDVTVAAKTASGSLEIARPQSIEVNLGDAADDVPSFVWEPARVPIVDGPGAVLFHLGAATADVTAYGNLKWIEYPTEDL